MFPLMNVFNHDKFIEIMLGDDFQAQNKQLGLVFTKKFTTNDRAKLIKAIDEKSKTVRENTPEYPGILFLQGLKQYLIGDYFRGVGYFQQSSQSGYGHAKIQLGMMYQSGLGVKQNFETAAFYIEEGFFGAIQKQVKVPAQVKLWTLACVCSAYFENSDDLFLEERMRVMKRCYDGGEGNGLMKNLFYSLLYLDAINVPAITAHIQKIKANIFAYVKKEIITKYLGHEPQSQIDKEQHLFSSTRHFSTRELKYFLLLLNSYADGANISGQEKRSIKELIALDNWSKNPKAAAALRDLAKIDPMAQYWLGNCYLKLIEENERLNTPVNRAFARKYFESAAKEPRMREKAEDKLLILGSLAEVGECTTLLSEVKQGAFPARFFPVETPIREIVATISQYYPELLSSDNQLNETTTTQLNEAVFKYGGKK